MAAGGVQYDSYSNYGTHVTNTNVHNNTDLAADIQEANEIADRTRQLLNDPSQSMQSAESGTWSQMTCMGTAMLGILANQGPQIHSQAANTTNSTAVITQIDYHMVQLSMAQSLNVAPAEYQQRFDQAQQLFLPNSEFSGRLQQSLGDQNKQLVTNGKLLDDFNKDPMQCMQKTKDLVKVDQQAQLTFFSTLFFVISMVNLVWTAVSCYKKCKEIANMRVEGRSLPDLRAELNAIEARISNNWNHAYRVMDAFRTQGIMPEPLVLQRISSTFHQITNELDTCLNRLQRMESKAESDATSSWNYGLANVAVAGLSVLFGMVTAGSPGFNAANMTAMNTATTAGYAGAAGLQFYKYSKACAKQEEIRVEIQRVRDIQGRLNQTIEQYDHYRIELQISTAPQHGQ